MAQIAWFDMESENNRIEAAKRLFLRFSRIRKNTKKFLSRYNRLKSGLSAVLILQRFILDEP